MVAKTELYTTRPSPLPQEKTLWGIQIGGAWWVDANGVVFFTPYSKVAEAQAAVLRRRGVEKLEIKPL